MTSITIPNSVTSIEGEAFSICTNLQTVVCHVATPLAYERIFNDCHSSLAIYVPSSSLSAYQDANGWNNHTLRSLSEVKIGDLYYELNGNNTATVTKTPDEENKYSGSVTIPATVAFAGINYSVTSIGESAFSYCTGLTSITIPNNVASIGDFAFWDCSNLQTVVCRAATPPVHDVTYDIFKNCPSSLVIYVPSGSLSAYQAADGWNNHTLRAIDHSITVGTIENGSVTAPERADFGDEVELTITPDAGYVLETLSVKDAENNDITVTDNKFTMPASAVTISATFSKVDYTITVNTAENGSVEVSQTVGNIGDTIALIVTTNYGYDLEAISVVDAENNPVAVENNTFVMPASNVTITATFVIDPTTLLERTTTSGIYVCNGMVICNEEFRVFTVTGVDVTNLNGNLDGIYLVRTATTTQKVVITR